MPSISATKAQGKHWLCTHAWLGWRHSRVKTDWETLSLSSDFRHIIVAFHSTFFRYSAYKQSVFVGFNELIGYLPLDDKASPPPPPAPNLRTAFWNRISQRVNVLSLIVTDRKHFKKWRPVSLLKRPLANCCKSRSYSSWESSAFNYQL